MLCPAETLKARLGVVSLRVDNVQVNAACLYKTLNDAEPLGCSAAALLKEEQKSMKRMTIPFNLALLPSLG